MPPCLKMKTLKWKVYFSKVLRAGRRTYFFDVRATKADDYYLTITESVKTTNSDGSFFFKKFKLFLYKEDFTKFLEFFKETTLYIIDKRGSEVINPNHKPNFKHQNKKENQTTVLTEVIITAQVLFQ